MKTRPSHEHGYAAAREPLGRPTPVFTAHDVRAPGGHPAAREPGPRVPDDPGAVRVDYTTQLRTPKRSARWYARTIAANAIPGL